MTPQLKPTFLFLLSISTVGVFFISGCTTPSSPTPPPPPPAPKIVLHPEWRTVLDTFRVKGSFSMYDPQENTFHLLDSADFHAGSTPASTFKIPNSLISLECKAVQDENEVLKWDGKTRRVESWNSDHDMKSAFKASCVWFYQEMARRVGEERMREYINKIDYGNRDIGPKIDSFWLNGRMRISPAQQIDFLKKFNEGQLPFSKNTCEVVKRIMIAEQTPEYTLRGKTGWGLDVNINIGWYVGWLEKSGKTYYFATRITSNDLSLPDQDFIKARIEISKVLLGLKKSEE